MLNLSNLKLKKFKTKIFYLFIQVKYENFTISTIKNLNWFKFTNNDNEKSL